MNYNFLFAFDLNYFKQGCVSIYSLLQNVNCKINIFVILDDSCSNMTFPNKISQHKNLNTLNIKKIDTEKLFYNVEFSHVSNATFYRLFLSELFISENFNITYLDADIVCVKDPQNAIQDAFNDMENEDKFIGFADELLRNQYEEPFIRLNMQSSKYFNAGVMLVNLGTWKKKRFSEKSFKVVENLKEKAKFWDQDVLNSLVDGEYYSISKNLNFRTSGLRKNTDTGESYFIHYSGKSKPWDVGGVFEDSAEKYHTYFKELFDKKFHIVVKNRKNATIRLIKNIKNFNILEVTDLIQYLSKSLIAIIYKK